MKLRIKGDSLRLRLTRGEVGQLASDGQLTESMHLPAATLTYAVRSDPAVDSVSAELIESRLTVVIPAEQIQSWAHSEQVSLQGQTGPLRILVEKDFACLQPRDGEDDADAFPHPGQDCHE